MYSLNTYKLISNIKKTLKTTKISEHFPIHMYVYSQTTFIVSFLGVPNESFNVFYVLLFCFYIHIGF